jgi:cell division protein FtsB
MLYLLEMALVLLIFVFFLIQIIIPIWNGTQLFPTFRGKARQIEQEMRQVNSEIELTEQERILSEQKKKLAKLSLPKEDEKKES